MLNDQYIKDGPLPIDQDFKILKETGIAYIQSYSNYEWSNLNPSDPGITILDQICYALTELGYCNDFSIEDILTNEKGKIEFKNQFFLAEQILTTTPTNVNDYKKFLIDEVKEILNVIILSASNSKIELCEKQI